MNNEISYLLSAQAVRERTLKIYNLAKYGKTHFDLHEDKLQEVSSYVIDVIKENYPDLKIPFHSRWGHFKVGGIDRNKKLDSIIENEDIYEQARIKLDLVITSVLLDAGAGPTWSFIEDDKKYNRSEGLGVASWHMFMDKSFSNDSNLKADAEKLLQITAEDISKGFQVSEHNPLVGLEGRAGLLKSLGKCLKSKPEIFKDARPGNILDHMLKNYGKNFAATELLQEVLLHLGDIWPSRIVKDGITLGDVWHYPELGEADDLSALVPFHKLSQWLTYSLIEAIETAGVTIYGADQMTGLAEYRNGGLLIDMELITLKDQSLMKKAHLPGSELIIEWRALTIVMLDKIADLVRAELGFTPKEFPLAKVLEGGTWWAGRKIAAVKRADLSPPLKLESDGTVF